MGLWSIITTIVVGLILGLVGRLVVPGKQDIPLWLTIIVGIVASFVGAFIAKAIGVDETRGIDWIELIIKIVLAAVFVVLAANLWARRGART